MGIVYHKDNTSNSNKINFPQILDVMEENENVDYKFTFRDNDKDTWERVQFLMDHDEERKQEVEYWNMFQRNVVDFMRKSLKLADVYSEEEIHRAIGILRTNAFQIEHPYLAEQGTSGKVLK